MSEESPKSNMATSSLPGPLLDIDTPTEETTLTDVENGHSSNRNNGAVADNHDNQTQTDIHIKKLELKVSGFIDLSGLVATFAVLVLLLSQPNRNQYFAPVLVFVFLSMIMQCVLAVILVIRHNTLDAESHHMMSGGASTSEEDTKWYVRESRRLLFISSISLTFIMVFNILIAAFVGLAGSPTTLPSSDCPTY